MLIWNTLDNIIAVAYAQSEHRVAQDVTEAITQRFGAADRQIGRPVEMVGDLDRRILSDEWPRQEIVLALVSDELLKRVDGPGSFDRWAKQTRERGVQVLPVRVGTSGVRTGLVEIELIEYGVSGLVDLFLQRLEWQLENRLPRLSLSNWPIIDRKELGGLVKQLAEWDPESLRRNLQLDFVVPRNAQALRKWLIDPPLGVTGNQDALYLAHNIIKRVDEDLCQVMERGIARLIAARVDHGMELTPLTIEAVKLYAFTKMGALLVHLAKVDLCYDEVPEWVEQLRQFSGAFDSFLDGLVSTTGSLGREEDFWIDARLVEPEQCIGHQYPSFYIPGSCFLDSLIKNESEIPFDGPVFPAIAAQLADGVDRNANLRYAFAFPKRFYVKTIGKCVIDGQTAERYPIHSQALGAVRTRVLDKLPVRIAEIFSNTGPAYRQRIKSITITALEFRGFLGDNDG